MAAVLVALLLTTHPLPAPIHEHPEQKPTTPSPAQKPKEKSPVKSTKPQPTSKSEPRAAAPARRSRFAGTWVGTMPMIPWGNVAVELSVDSTEKTMASGGVTVKAKLNDETLQATFPAGLTTATYSLTPQPDGATARVRFQAIMNDQTATFHRAVAAPSAAKPTR
jgi:hypothetical protein